MTIARDIHDKFGGCALYRAQRIDGVLMHGAWAASDPALWEETASLTLGELETKLDAMAPRQIAYKPDEPWANAGTLNKSGDIQRSRQRGADVNRGRSRAAREGRVAKPEQLALALGA